MTYKASTPEFRNWFKENLRRWQIKFVRQELTTYVEARARMSEDGCPWYWDNEDLKRI